jgi:hypothetical protein
MNRLLSSHLYDNNTFYKAFNKDLQNALHSALIESPFITPKPYEYITASTSGITTVRCSCSRQYTQPGGTRCGVRRTSHSSNSNDARYWHYGTLYR